MEENRGRDIQIGIAVEIFMLISYIVFMYIRFYGFWYNMGITLDIMLSGVIVGSFCIGGILIVLGLILINWEDGSKAKWHHLFYNGK